MDDPAVEVPGLLNERRGRGERHAAPLRSASRRATPRHSSIRFLCLELTQACEYACLHCYNSWRDGPDASPDAGRRPLSRADIRSLLTQTRLGSRLEHVGLTGGEPTLRPDFPGIVGDIVDCGLTPVVITNGSRLTPALLDRMPPGVNYEVTLFSYREALHNALAGNEVFYDVLRNIARIRGHGSYLTVAFVATRRNALDVFKTVELGLGVGANGIMYNRVNLGATARKIGRQLVPPATMLKESLGQLQEAVRKYKVQTACTIPVPPCVVDPRAFPDLHFGWCPRGGAQSYYTVSTTGLLRPCNHSSRILGDLRVSGFAELQRRSQGVVVLAHCTRCLPGLQAPARPQMQRRMPSCRR